MLHIEAFLFAFVLDNVQHVWVGKDLFALRLQIAEGIGVDVFDLDGDIVRLGTKGHDGIIVLETATGELPCQSAAGTIGIRIQHMATDVPIGRSLYQHLAQLSATKDV